MLNYPMLNYGFLRCACVSPQLVVADCTYNANKIIDSLYDLDNKGVKVAVFPELSITSYTAGDLLLQTTLQDAAMREVGRIADETKTFSTLFFVGLPVSFNNMLFNTACAIHRGQILCFIAKTFIPNYSEFYEKRYFTSGKVLKKNTIFNTIYVSEKFPAVPIGVNILIKDSSFPVTISAELCEDLWASSSPSSKLAEAGALVIANLSASNEVIGKKEYRRMLVGAVSGKTATAYLYSDASSAESTSDLVFGGHNIICENGRILKESRPLSQNSCIISDIDIELLLQERRRNTSFSLSTTKAYKEFRTVQVNLFSKKEQEFPLKRSISKTPFVPVDKSKGEEVFSFIIHLLVAALSKRLTHLGIKRVVIGLSGGLDSTLAFLIAARTFDMLELKRADIYAYTMPCFGTTDRTYKNATGLATMYGATLKEVSIKEAVTQHLKDLGHDSNIQNNAYENAQARERTQLLMDAANDLNAIVLGTGDLSEAALGWCTYNGDQMSMYNVNASVPKTLVRHIVEYFAKDIKSTSKEVSDLLLDIIDTPITPELLPSNKKDGISQRTEDIIGPYELHDFFLYYMVRYGFSPSKILFLADHASFSYTHEEMLKWLQVFYKRFFTSQYKRDASPNGPKIGTVSLSPRGDFRAPSDASYREWITEVFNIE